MSSKIVKKTEGELIIELSIKLDSNSMLKSEEKIQKALNEAGVLASGIALEQFDTDGGDIEVNGVKMTSKGKEKKNTNRPKE